MKSDPSDSSSEADLARARAITQRLRGASAAPAAATEGYAPFSARAFRPAVEEVAPAEEFAPAEESVAVEELPPTPIEAVAPLEIGGDGPARLESCREALGAETAFIIDGNGLLVANVGALAREEVEVIGARLAIALQQADEMQAGGHASRALAIDFGGLWLTGVRLPDNGVEPLIAGFLAARPLPTEAQALVPQAFPA